MTIGKETNVHNLSGLSLAKYVLERLVDNRDGVKRIAENFDNDKGFVLNIVDYLDEIGWLGQFSCQNEDYPTE